MGDRWYRLSFLLFPGNCVLCRAPSLRALDLCAACEADLPVLLEQCGICALPLPLPLAGATCGECLVRPPGFSRARVPFRYETPVDGLIKRFKRGDLASGRVLSHLLETHLRTVLTEPPQVLLPVPLHWRRALWRGFNQAQQLAADLSASMAIASAPHRLRRVKPTPSQRSLNRAARRRNLRAAFVVNGSLAGLRVAIIDDVVTTGSTADTLAQTLRMAGAADVELWALARTPLAK